VFRNFLNSYIYIAVVQVYCTQADCLVFCICLSDLSKSNRGICAVLMAFKSRGQQPLRQPSFDTVPIRTRYDLVRAL